MYPRIKTIIAEARLEPGGGSSPASPGASESDSSSSADEFCPHEQGEFRRHASPLSSSASQFPVSSPRELDDVHEHHQRMLLLLPAFASPADAAARAGAVSQWLSGFDVSWVLDMGASGRGNNGGALPRRELGRRVSAWAKAGSTLLVLQ